MFDLTTMLSVPSLSDYPFEALEPPAGLLIRPYHAEIIFQHPTAYGVDVRVVLYSFPEDNRFTLHTSLSDNMPLPPAASLELDAYLRHVHSLIFENIHQRTRFLLSHTTFTVYNDLD